MAGAREKWDAEAGLSLKGTAPDGTPFFAKITISTLAASSSTAWTVADRIAEHLHEIFNKPED